MPCKKGTKHLPQAIRERIASEHEKGATRKELAERYGKLFEYIKGVIRDESRKKRQLAAGMALKKKGRPAKNLVPEQDIVKDLRYKLARKDYRIKQLEMENELMRDFLKETERS